LKWIRSGILPAQRTAGGHHRIDAKDLERVLNRRQSTPEPALGKKSARRFRYCWEYNEKGDGHGVCKECAVFHMRAQRCYELARFAPDAFHPKVYCKKTCEECDYFKEVHGQKTNVLVVTDNSKLANALLDEAGATLFNLEVADCEYSCSMAVNHFKPDFAVIDCSLGQEASRDITRHLFDDPRVPFVRVVLAANDGEFPDECEKIVFARLKRPFGIDDISDCIDGAKSEP
jgi:hypothetical protein